MLTILPPGKPVSHQFAKELLVGLAGAEVDKLAETKGMDFIDREKAKHHAKENVENMYDEHYVQNQGADQYDPYVCLCSPSHPLNCQLNTSLLWI